jgi:hypothetical protein
MCDGWWTYRERRRQERFDEELRYLLDEEERPERPTPVVEHEPEVEPEQPRVEAGSTA